MTATPPIAGLPGVLHLVVGEGFVEWPDGAEGLAEAEAVGAYPPSGW
jgi:hypothetical protein